MLGSISLLLYLYFQLAKNYSSSKSNLCYPTCDLFLCNVRFFFVLFFLLQNLWSEYCLERVLDNKYTIFLLCWHQFKRPMILQLHLTTTVSRSLLLHNCIRSAGLLFYLSGVYFSTHPPQVFSLDNAINSVGLLSQYELTYCSQ